ncbi:MAG: FtsL-like putative cell division protein [Candidatus Ratteibacteria bacterium]|nr:FtsL-like putative cell division protein [Candidatus Ratteibacteria bacterium]
MRKITKGRGNLKQNSKTFFAIFFILTIALFVVHLRVLINNLQYEISGSNKTEKELLKDRETLKKELEFLKSPSRIEKEALRNGMNFPEKWQIRTIKVKPMVD